MRNVSLSADQTRGRNDFRIKRFTTAFSEFIKSMPLLETFRANFDFFSSLDSVITNLTSATCPRLSSVTLAPLVNVYDHDIAKLCRATFPKLKWVKLVGQEQYIKHLVPGMSQVQSLLLEVSGPSDSALRNCAAFPNLRTFSLEFESNQVCVIKGVDLFLFAQGSPMLTHLEIVTEVEDSNELLTEDITDELLDHVAKALPRLEQLIINAYTTSLTEVCLFSIGEQCKNLKSFDMPVKISFTNFFEKAPLNLFPALEDFDPGDMGWNDE